MRARPHAVPAAAAVFALVAAGCGTFSATDVTAGGTRSCMKTTVDTVKCWGGRALSGGVLGTDGYEGNLTPNTIANTSGTTRMCAGRHFGCARIQGGTVKCWGAGATDGSAKEVGGLVDIQDLACGEAGGCALTAAGGLRCWDWTEEGPGAVESVGTLTVSAVAVGARHRCALSDGKVFCWGQNDEGQLGADPAITARSDEPVEVAGLAGVKAVSAGEGHTCALGTDGRVRCWGANGDGQLGRAGEGSPEPVEVEGLEGVVQLVSGGGHTCVLSGGGTVRCWGQNRFGQLGDGTDVKRPRPVEVKDLAGVKAVAAGTAHTCALHGEGEVSCWGRNLLGQVGDGTRDDRYTPAAVDTTSS